MQSKENMNFAYLERWYINKPDRQNFEMITERQETFASIEQNDFHIKHC